MWFILSLFFALWASISVAISKRVLKTTDVLVFIVFGNLLAIISMGTLLIIRGISRIDVQFVVLVLVSSLLGIIVQLSYIKAIKIAPISLTAPMAAATPLIATIFGFLFLNEQVTITKLFGVSLIVIGVYLIDIKDAKKGLFAPFKKLFTNRGVQLMLLAQSLVGVTPVLEKTAISHTMPREPLMIPVFSLFINVLVFLPLMIVRSKNPLAQFKKNIWWYILPAPITALSFWAAYTAYSIANLGYVTAIFKLSVLFTILFGWLIFKDEKIKERLLGASVMTAGTILLVS